MGESAHSFQVAQASGAWALDVWRAVEREPGRLDPERLERLIDALRRPPPPSAAPRPTTSPQS